MGTCELGVLRISTGLELVGFGAMSGIDWVLSDTLLAIFHALQYLQQKLSPDISQT